MAQYYSTENVYARRRAAQGRDENRDPCAHGELHSEVGPFAEKRIGSVAELDFSVLSRDPSEMARPRRNPMKDAGDSLVLFVQLAGRSVLRQDGREAVLETGDLTLLDMSRKFSAGHCSETRRIRVFVPRSPLEERLGPAAGLTARKLESHNPLTGLAVGFLAKLPDLAGTLDAPSASKVAEQALDLVALAYSSETERRDATLSSPRTLTVLRLKSVIEARVYDPGLKPAAVAAAAGISVRYANALLAHDGTSLERYIQQRRLERCRDALDDPTQAHRTIGEIAFGWGFANLSHFGRRFKAEYGLSPKDYRQRAARGRSHPHAAGAAAPA